MYLAYGILFLFGSLLMMFGIIFTLARSGKVDGEFISKKNLLFIAPAFLLLYLLFVTASAFNGEDIDFFYLFALVNTTLETIKFKSPTGLILPICQTYPIFYVDFVLALLVGAATVILSVASFFSQRLRNFFVTRRLLRNNCDLVLGDSPDAIKYINNTKYCILFGDNIPRYRYDELMKSRISIIKETLSSKSLPKRLSKGTHNIIVFRDAKYSYTKIIDAFTRLKNCGCKITVHLEANQEEMKIIKEKFVAQTDFGINANIYCFSKYELIARKFVEDYPITKYIPREFYNKNFSLKDGHDINVVFIGFGRMNYQLFRMCAMQFQFAKQSGGKLVSQPVNYYIYDKEETAMHNEFFSRIEFEVGEEFKNCDFPPPDPICKVETRRLDNNSVEAKRKFKELVTKNSFTYFVISLNDDLEDASYAQTVKRLLADERNYKIFVRAKNNNEETLNNANDPIIYFGEEKRLYSHDTIVNDDLTELSMRLNLLYNNISNPPEWLTTLKKLPTDKQNEFMANRLSDPENSAYMHKKWSELDYIEQLSNIYHALNLPFKLNLLGFDMKKNSQSEKGITEAEFDEAYINTGRSQNYSDYSFYFNTESSNVLAFIEHSRWNALYILYDYKQMSKDLMKVESSCKDGKTVREVAHKDSELKLHGCLTTYYGLNELITYKYKLLNPDAKSLPSEGDECLLELSKIYTYDYMDLDRLYGEVTALGYIITKKSK